MLTYPLLHLIFLFGKVWSTTGGKKILEWTDPVAAQDDSYSCIACSSVQKKVFCVELRCHPLYCCIISVFDWRCFLQQKKDGNLIVTAVGTANGEVLALDSTGVIWRSVFHTGYVKSYHELNISLV
jgi:hypothetical protein